MYLYHVEACRTSRVPPLHVYTEQSLPLPLTFPLSLPFAYVFKTAKQHTLCESCKESKFAKSTLACPRGGGEGAKKTKTNKQTTNKQISPKGGTWVEKSGGPRLKPVTYYVLSKSQ